MSALNSPTIGHLKRASWKSEASHIIWSDRLICIGNHYTHLSQAGKGNSNEQRPQQQQQTERTESCLLLLLHTHLAVPEWGTLVLWYFAVVCIVVPVLADYNLCPPIVSSTHSHTSQSVRVTFLLTNCVDFCACLVDCCRHEGSPGYSTPYPVFSCCCLAVCGLCQWHFKLQTTGTGNCHLCASVPGPAARIRASTARSTAIKQTNSIM